MDRPREPRDATRAAVAFADTGEGVYPNAAPPAPLAPWGAPSCGLSVAAATTAKSGALGSLGSRRWRGGGAARSSARACSRRLPLMPAPSRASSRAAISSAPSGCECRARVSPALCAWSFRSPYRPGGPADAPPPRLVSSCCFRSRACDRSSCVAHTQSVRHMCVRVLHTVGPRKRRQGVFHKQRGPTLGMDRSPGEGLGDTHLTLLVTATRPSVPLTAS
jgi:hypothetical protein